jgi:small nuclear ribonucleoprotein (snRNP)-like protein
LEEVEGMTQTEFRKKVMSYIRKLPQIYQEQVRDYLTEIKGQLYSTDEELFRSMKDVFKDLKKERERQTFKLK